MIVSFGRPSPGDVPGRPGRLDLGGGASPRMIQAWSMVGGAISRRSRRPGRLVGDVDRVLVAHGLDPVPDHGLVDRVAATGRARPATGPRALANAALWSG